MRYSLILFLSLVLTVPCYAHSGRLDWKGGHKINKEFVYEGSYIEIINNQPFLKKGKIIFKNGDYHFHCKPSLNKIEHDTYRDGIYLPVKEPKEVADEN